MFCELNKDLETFNFFKEYFHKTKDIKDQKELFNIDNKLQYEEIKKHLFLNQRSLQDLYESCNWVKDYSASYRVYLNSLKILKLIFDCICATQNKTINDITFEDFQKIEEIFNNEKDFLLELIFN